MVGRSHLGEPCHVVGGSLVVLAGFKIHVAQHHIDGHEEIGREDRGRRHIAEVGRQGIVSVGILLQVGSQAADHAGHVELGEGAVVDVGNLGERLGVEGHLLVGAGELHVGPGAQGLHTHILAHGHIVGTGAEGGVAMGNVVVAVVDDAIVDVGRVVLVRSRGREVGQLAQVVVGVVGGFHQVAPHLALEHVLVGQLLHALKDAEGIVDRVGLLVEGGVEDLTRAVGFEHIAAGNEE